MHTPLRASHRRTPAPRPIALLLVLALVLTSALTSAAMASTPVEGTSLRQATFTVAGPGFDGVTLDPALATDGGSLLIARQIYDTLAVYQEGGSVPAPGLASSWDVSADGLTWTFHLRSGVQFHDGTALNAAAVVANVNRWWDASNPYHQGDFVYFESLFGGFKGDPECLLQQVSAAGNDIVMTLTEPFSPLLSVLAFQAFGIASPAAFAGGALATAPVGSGPFRFVERVEADHVTLAANTAYWDGAPASGELVFRAMSSFTDRLDALKAGEVQVADFVYAPSDETIRSLSRGATNIGYLGINRSHAPLGDPLVRQAIAHLVNKSEIAAVGGGQSASQFLPTGIWGRDPDITDYTYDPALARWLLAQAGYPSGLTTTLAYRNVARGYMPNPPAVAQGLKADFAAGGITLDVLEIESAEFLDRVYSGDVDLFLLGWGADYPHPDNFFRPHFCLNREPFLPQDEALCDAVGDALRSDSFEEQQSLYEWASRRVHETIPVVPLMSGASSMAVRYNVVGVQPSSVFAESYRLASLASEGSTTVTPETGGAAGFAADGTFTSVQIPAGAVSEPTTVTISPTNAEQLPSGLASTGRAFDVASSAGAASAGAASSGARSPQTMILDKPAVLTVEYTGEDISRIREQSLHLYAWDGAAWTPASQTCSPASNLTLNMADRRVIVPVCQLGRFALLGEPLKSLYLPMLRR